MRDGEWTLTAGSEAYTFGPADRDVFLSGPPDLGDYEITVEDLALTGADGVIMGADYFGGRTISFDLKISKPTEAEALEALGGFLRAWRGDAVRGVSGATATLSVRRAGRERVVYGRPRKVTPDLTEAPEGVIGIAASFSTTGAAWLGPTDRVATVSIVPAPGGGFVAPFTFPLTSTESSDRSTSFTVDGELAVWPIVEIVGPVVAPSVEVVGLWRMDFPNVSLSASQTLRVDARPWVRTITRNGASLAGSISRSSVRLQDADLPPGTYEFVVRGTSETGTASARLRWRDTYTSL